LSTILVSICTDPCCIPYVESSRLRNRLVNHLRRHLS
jgi:hypothetical protein